MCASLTATLPFSPACERNKEPIRAALAEILPESGTLLEIGSGTGQHGIYLAAAFPQLIWQCTEREAMLATLQRRLAAEGTANLLPSVALDVLQTPWPDSSYTAAFSANTAHIMSWLGVCALFQGLATVLSNQAPFALYGPFHYQGIHTASSNAAFDAQLRARDSSMGIRDALQVQAQASISGFSLDQDIAMPANNRLLVFRREAS